MKKLGILFLVIILLVLPCLCACDALWGDDPENEVTCGLCGLVYPEWYDAFIACTLTSNHGVGHCVEKAPCMIEEHYLLMGKTVDKDGRAHTACPYCSELLCQGAHGVGACCEQAPCGIDGHYVMPGTMTGFDGVDHSECEYCRSHVCQGEHGLDKCYKKAPCGLDGHFVIIGETIDGNGLDHSDCEFCHEYNCQGDHGVGICVSADATLKSLTVSCFGQVLSMSPTFDGQNSFMYFVGENRTTYAGESVMVMAEANHPAATVSGLGSYTLSEGANTITIQVTAQYTQIRQEYIVTVVSVRYQPPEDPYIDRDTPPGGW